MRIRLILFLIISLGAMALFFLVPELNIGSERAISLYQELKAGGSLFAIILRVLILGGVFFMALVFLFGLRPKGKPKQQQPPDDE